MLNVIRKIPLNNNYILLHKYILYSEAVGLTSKYKVIVKKMQVMNDKYIMACV